MGERIAHPMYPAALLGCMEDFAGSGAKPFVVVCDDKFDAPEPAIGKRAQEALPEGFSLGWAGTNAQYLTAAIVARSEEHTSELQSLMRNSYAGFCLKKK